MTLLPGHLPPEQRNVLGGWSVIEDHNKQPKQSRETGRCSGSGDKTVLPQTAFKSFQASWPVDRFCRQP